MPRKVRKALRVWRAPLPEGRDRELPPPLSAAGPLADGADDFKPHNPVVADSRGGGWKSTLLVAVCLALLGCGIFAHYLFAKSCRPVAGGFSIAEDLKKLGYAEPAIARRIAARAATILKISEREPVRQFGGPQHPDENVLSPSDFVDTGVDLGLDVGVVRTSLSASFFDKVLLWALGYRVVVVSGDIVLINDRVHLTLRLDGVSSAFVMTGAPRDLSQLIAHAGDVVAAHLTVRNPQNKPLTSSWRLRSSGYAKTAVMAMNLYATEKGICQVPVFEYEWGMALWDAGRSDEALEKIERSGDSDVQNIADACNSTTVDEDAKSLGYSVNPEIVATALAQLSNDESKPTVALRHLMGHEQTSVAAVYQRARAYVMRDEYEPAEGLLRAFVSRWTGDQTECQILPERQNDAEYQQNQTGVHEHIVQAYALWAAMEYALGHVAAADADLERAKTCITSFGLGPDFRLVAWRTWVDGHLDNGCDGQSGCYTDVLDDIRSALQAYPRRFDFKQNYADVLWKVGQRDRAKRLIMSALNDRLGFSDAENSEERDSRLQALTWLCSRRIDNYCRELEAQGLDGRLAVILNSPMGTLDPKEQLRSLEEALSDSEVSSVSQRAGQLKRAELLRAAGGTIRALGLPLPTDMASTFREKVVGYIDAGRLADADALVREQPDLFSLTDEDELEAWLAYGKGDLQKAEELAASAVGRHPTWDRLVDYYAQVLGAEGKFDQARELGWTLARSKPELSTGTKILVRVAWQELTAHFYPGVDFEFGLDSLAKAGATPRPELSGLALALEHALELDGSDAEAWTWLATIKMASGELDAAAAVLSAAARLLPYSLPIKAQRARLAALGGDYEAAIRSMLDVLGQVPVDGASLLLMGAIRERAGMYRAASDCYRRAIALSSLALTAQQALARVTPRLRGPAASGFDDVHGCREVQSPPAAPSTR